MSEAKTMLKLTKKGDYESSHLDNFDKRYSSNNDKDTEIPDIKHITSITDYSINKHIIFTQSRLDILSNGSKFKSIEFDDS